jgi:hypothetical protein
MASKLHAGFSSSGSLLLGSGCKESNSIDSGKLLLISNDFRVQKRASFASLSPFFPHIEVLPSQLFGFDVAAS